VIRYLEVPFPSNPYDAPDYTEPDRFYCSMGLYCCSVDPTPLGVHLSGDEDRPYWHLPFAPAGADETDTSLWVCEDCACWIEDMHAVRELFLGLP
jgi:hypothetical protein